MTHPEARPFRGRLLPVEFPPDEVQPCRGDARFTSEHRADHHAVRATCFNHCPIASFTACQELAKAEGINAYGTYAGVGYGLFVGARRPRKDET